MKQQLTNAQRSYLRLKILRAIKKYPELKKIVEEKLKEFEINRLNQDSNL